MRIRVTIERDELRTEPQARQLFTLLPRRRGPSFKTWLPSMCVHAAVLALGLTHGSAAVPSGGPRGHGDPLIIRLDGRTYRVTRLPAKLVMPGSIANKGTDSLQPERHTKDDRGAMAAGGTRKRAPHTVIRGDLPPDVIPDPDQTGPNIAAWTADIPTMTPNAPVHPGSPRQESAQDGAGELPSVQRTSAQQRDEFQKVPVRAIASGRDEDTARAVVPAGNAGEPASIAGAGGQARGAGQDAGGENGTTAVPSGLSAESNVVLITTPEERASEAQMVTIRRPETGQFDTLIVQSSAVELFDGAGGMLSGKPVYTVYLPMGTRKDWILQYCSPASATAPKEETGPLIRLQAETRVEGPWPTLMQRIPVALPPGERYLVLHGYVNASGRFERLTVVRAGRPETNTAMLRALSGWEFRPARQDNVALTVEIMLAIPADIT